MASEEQGERTPNHQPSKPSAISSDTIADTASSTANISTTNRGVSPTPVYDGDPGSDTTREFVLGVDLDGVCADYHIGFRDIVAVEKGMDPASMTRPNTWGYEHWGVDEEEFVRLHKMAVVEKRMFRDLPVIEGCPEALWRLSDLGVWIRIITHRLYVNWGHSITVSDTVTWLDEHRIPYRDICFLGDKPQVGADAYIDDAPHNITALRAAGNTAIVFDQPHNQDLAGPRVSSWTEVEALVTDLAAQTRDLQPQLPGIDAGADRLDRNREQR